MRGDSSVSIFELLDYYRQDNFNTEHSGYTFEKGYNMIQLLASHGLLEIVDNGVAIMMHSVLRDLALWIISTDPPTKWLPKSRSHGDSGSEVWCYVMCRAGAGLTEVSSKLEWSETKIMFLMNNEISCLTETPACPSLMGLFLQRNRHLRLIASTFFDFMPSLQVLNLSGTRIRTLPPSLFKLRILKILVLRDCVRLLVIPADVGRLGNLERLDLLGTDIDCLPVEIGELTHMKDLQVSFHHDGEFDKMSSRLVPPNTVSKFSKLEHLSIVLHPGDQRWSNIAHDVTTELSNLTCLTSLVFYFPKVELLEAFQLGLAWARGLTRFSFVVGEIVKRLDSRISGLVESDYSEYEKCLRFVNVDSIPQAITEVLSRATAFYLDHHLNVHTLSEFGLGSVNGLKFCLIRECQEIETLIDFSDTGKVILPFLEHLSLHYLWNLTSIWECPVAPGSFGCLKILSLHVCPEIISVFTYSMFSFLGNLEELAVEDCAKIKDIIADEDDMNPYNFSPPSKLRRLTLHNLPAMVSIWKGVWPLLEHMSFYACWKLTSIGLDSKVRHSLIEIKGERDWWEELEWEESIFCSHLEACFVEISAEDL